MIEGLKDNQLVSVWKWFYNSLKEDYPENELSSIRNIFFEHYFNIKQTDIVLKKDLLFSESDIVTVIKGIKKLKNNVPLQYITGKAYFLDYTFNVNENTLIPRKETEELVLMASDVISRKYPYLKQVKILDIGTGSGCIAVSIANRIKNSYVTAVDISDKTLEVAKSNADLIGVKVNFLKYNIFDELKAHNIHYDVIISNPPYVRELEKAHMHNNVLDYEPEIALFVDDSDPLLYYREICKKAQQGLLVENGMLFFEINEYLSDETASLIRKYGFDSIEIHEDINGKKRFISALLSKL
ncbi:MAG: peptide chain release factor N(5)-glutamine methyltransferase [Bacteroidales bacterium]